MHSNRSLQHVISLYTQLDLNVHTILVPWTGMLTGAANLALSVSLTQLTGTHSGPRRREGVQWNVPASEEQHSLAVPRLSSFFAVDGIIE